MKRYSAFESSSNRIVPLWLRHGRDALAETDGSEHGPHKRTTERRASVARKSVVDWAACDSSTNEARVVSCKTLQSLRSPARASSPLWEPQDGDSLRLAPDLASLIM